MTLLLLFRHHDVEPPIEEGGSGGGGLKPRFVTRTEFTTLPILGNILHDMKLDIFAELFRIDELLVSGKLDRQQIVETLGQLGLNDKRILYGKLSRLEKKKITERGSLDIYSRILSLLDEL